MQHTVVYVYEFTCVYESYRIWQQAQDLSRFKSNGVPKLRWRNQYWVPLLAEKLSSTDTLCQRKMPFFSMGHHWAYKPHFRESPMLRSKWPKQNKREYHFLYFLLNFTLLLTFVILLVFCLLISYFNFPGIL